MKKIIFKVNLPSQKENLVISLLKEINKISCQIYLDLENGYVTVENINDNMIDSVIELVNNYYTILGVDIDNTFETTTDQQFAPVVVDSSPSSTADTVNEFTEVTTSKHPTILAPQSEDDLIIKKVEFENKNVENRINSFLKTAYWAIYNKQATEKEISEHILTCMSEISMRYSSKPVIKFSIGDIIDTNYGSHLPGEIMGGHVHAIVCNILNDDMAYVVPITKVRNDISSPSYLLMDTPQDAIYNNECSKGGTVIIDKGKYIRIERFNSVIGKTKPEFFEKLLHQLASTFDFTKYLHATVKNHNNLPTNKVVKTAKKVGSEEEALLETIGFALDKLDSSKKATEQIESFLADIGMITTEKMVTNSFIIACDIKKINYENVLLGLHKKFPTVKERVIKIILKKSFKNWLNKYPTLADKCPKISLISILKVFAKRFA